MPETVECGTLAGYSRHVRRGEQRCQPCRDAKAEYQRARDARQKLCQHQGCRRSSRARGYCGTHLSRLHRHGRVDPVPYSQRFWLHVIVPVNHFAGCWLWSGRRGSKGYGRFDPQRGVHLIAHRYAYEQVRGPIPAGLELDHLCRKTICVNPWHLEPVTRAENVRREHEARRCLA